MRRESIPTCILTALAIAGFASSLSFPVAVAAPAQQESARDESADKQSAETESAKKESADKQSEETHESKKRSTDEDTKKETATLAEGEGRDLVLTKCSVCHEPERVTRAYRDEQGWIDLVNNMVSRGAEVTPEEAQTISAYLFAHYGIH